MKRLQPSASDPKAVVEADFLQYLFGIGPAKKGIELLVRHRSHFLTTNLFPQTGRFAVHQLAPLLRRRPKANQRLQVASIMEGLLADELRQDFGADGIGEMVEQDRAAEATAAAPLGGLGHFALSVHSVGQSNARRLYCCQASLCSLITGTMAGHRWRPDHQDCGKVEFGRWS